MIINADKMGLEKALNRFAATYLSVTALFTAAAWNTAADHEVFTVTGLVRVRLMVESTGALTSEGAATIQLGFEGATTALIGSTTATDIIDNELWYDTTPTTQQDTFANVVFDRVVNELDIGYNIGTAALTGGSLVFHCWWEPISSTGLVVAAGGAAL